jgi:photosystem II stability/assembly factor-like uncharacterized protein
MISRATWSTRLQALGVVVLLACAGVSFAQTVNFGVQNPSPSPTGLYDIQYAGNGVLYAVGESNTLVKSADGGATWSIQSDDANAMTDFRSVFAATSTRAWAVGGWGRLNPGDSIQKGVMQWTNDGGASWRRQILTGASMLNDVYFSSPNQGWAVGRSTPALGSFYDQQASVYFTGDNGQNWSRQTNGIPTLTGYEFFNVAFFNNSTGYVIGGQAQQQAGGNNPWTGQVVLNTQSSGASWSWQWLPGNWNPSSTTPVSLTKAYMAGDESGYAALFYTNDAGSSWNQVTTNVPTPTEGHFNNVVFANTNVGYAFGYRNDVWPNTVLVYKTTNGGNSWSDASPGIVIDFDGYVSRGTASADNNVWICGSRTGGWVLHSADAGSTWEWQSNNVSIDKVNSYGSGLKDASFSDLLNGWAVGSTYALRDETDYPTLLHTTNGGTTWVNVSSALPYTNGSLRGVAVQDANNIWAVGYDNSIGSILLRSSNAGLTFEVVMSGNNGQFTDVEFSDNNPSLGYVSVDQNTGFFTSDGGATWNSASGDGQFQRIGYFHGKTVWAVNSDTYGKSDDGGANWTTWGAANLTGSYGNNYLTGISFIPSGQYGWIVGSYQFGYIDKAKKGGSSIQAAGPRSGDQVPLIAYTADGGNSWSLQNTFLQPNPAAPCATCPPYIADAWPNNFDHVVDVVAVTPSTAVAVTGLYYRWPYKGARLIATTNNGSAWVEFDSSFQAINYDRLMGRVTNRIDGYGLGKNHQIRHGYLNVPIIAWGPNSLFDGVVLSYAPTDSMDQRIMLRNVGSADLDISSIDIEDAGTDPVSAPRFNYLPLISAPSMIAAGDTAYITVRFKPDQFAPRHATLKVYSNSIDNPVFSVDLLGAGGLAVVQVDPSSLFRDTVAIDGGYEDGVIHICNPGVTRIHADVHVGNITLIDSVHEANYSILYRPTGSLAPGQCDSVVVRFQPATGGRKAGSVTVNTNSRDYPQFLVSLGGVGGVRAIATDTNAASFTDTVLCSHSASACLTVRNTGTLPLKIDSVIVYDARGSEFAIAKNLRATIATGRTDTVCFSFAPQAIGNNASYAVIFSNALNIATDTIRLNGRGLRAIFSVGTHTFMKTVNCNETYDTALTITNTGNIPMRITPLGLPLPFPWELILPFPSTVDTNGRLRVRYDQVNVKRDDTLRFVLQWGNTGCGPLSQDTMVFIYTNNCGTAVREEGISVTDYALYQNFPNPFNPTTSIEYAVPQRSHVTLKVYNAIGETMATIVDEVQTAGKYKQTFDATNLPSGSYFYEITAGTFQKRMIMTLNK